jgi:hypothetical protein
MKSLDTQIYTGTDYTPELDTYNPFQVDGYKAQIYLDDSGAVDYI